MKYSIGYSSVAPALGLAYFPYFINIKYGRQEKSGLDAKKIIVIVPSFPTNERSINNYNTKTINTTTLMFDACSEKKVINGIFVLCN